MPRIRTSIAALLLVATFGAPAVADELDQALGADTPKITAIGNQSLALDRRAIDSAVSETMGPAGQETVLQAPDLTDIERPVDAKHVVLELKLLPSGPQSRLTLGQARGYESAERANTEALRNRRFDSSIANGPKANSFIRIPLRLDLADD